MTSYTVRIELHDATDDDYKKLHKAMESKQFVRWIDSTNGTRYMLPTAEYNMKNTSLTVSDVLALATDAAKSIKPKPTPWVLVTESWRRRWTGLKP